MNLRKNLDTTSGVHVVINNGAYETVGGMPTVANKISLPAVAKACGYDTVDYVDDFDSLDKVLKRSKEKAGLHFIEIASVHLSTKIGHKTKKSGIKNESLYKIYQLFWHPSSLLDKPCHR